MTRWTQADVDALQHKRAASAPKPSKYRNVKIQIDGEKFDSKREAQYWQELKLREKAGEIWDLHRQVEFELYAPVHGSNGSACVATYIADFIFRDVGRDGSLHVVDVKGGKLTAMFALKAKWLALQSNLTIEVVR